LADVDAGIVDQDIDAAELASDTLDHAADGFLVGDIGCNGDRADAACRQISNRGLRLVLVAAGYGNVGAGIRKPVSHAEPDAAIASRDDGDLAFQIERFHRCASCFSWFSVP